MHSEVSPILRVTVGTPVFSWDSHRVGKVKEIQSDAFKVETGFLQRDYWLPAETITEAVADEAVLLSIEKDQLDDHKISEPAPIEDQHAA